MSRGASFTDAGRLFAWGLGAGPNPQAARAKFTPSFEFHIDF